MSGEQSVKKLRIHGVTFHYWKAKQRTFVNTNQINKELLVTLSIN